MVAMYMLKAVDVRKRLDKEHGSNQRQPVRSLDLLD